MESQQALLREIGSVGRLARGKLTAVARSNSGRGFYSLQYRKDTRHFVKYVPVREVEMYREATANYARLRKLFDAFIDDMSARTAKEIAKEAGKCKDRK